MKARTFLNQAEVISAFSTKLPHLECDFYLEVEAPGLKDNVSSFIPAVSYVFPTSPLTFGNQSNMLGHVSPSYSINTISVNYLVNDSENFLMEVWRDQFTESGILLAKGLDKMPRVNIYDKNTNECLVSMTGCRFSYPQPQINPSSTAPAVYSVTIAFEDIEL